MKAFTLFFCLVLSSLSLVFVPSAQAKSDFAPTGLYDVEQITLSNGLRVLLKPRTQAHTVSMRLVVHAGTRHFECERHETPHLIEHLLFSGTSKHSEEQLDRLVEEHGGSWNGMTGEEYTTYEIDIFDQYADLALNTLYEIMTDTVFTPEKLSKAKDIVTRELGGNPSFLQQFLYRYDIGKTAWRKADEWLLPGGRALCGAFPEMKKISHDDVLKTFRSIYTPNNMTLIAVGNFDPPALFNRIRRTFGSLEPAPAVPLTVPAVPYPSRGPVSVSGTLAPFLGSDGFVGVAFRTDGFDSPDAPAVTVLSSYVNRLVYEQVRIKNGFSYSPEASSFMKPDYGVLYVTADAGLQEINQVQDIIDRILKQLVQNPPTAEELKRTRQNLLLQWAQGYETNAGFADFYSDAVRDLDRTGQFRSYEREIEKVTAEDVRRVIGTVLRDDRRVSIKGIPTFSYTRFYTWIGVILFTLLLTVVYLLRRSMRREKRTAWYRR